MIRVGVAGWDYPDWEGTVYPSPHPRSFDRLAYLASIFDVIEINATFYRQPDPADQRLDGGVTNDASRIKMATIYPQ